MSLRYSCFFVFTLVAGLAQAQSPSQDSKQIYERRYRGMTNQEISFFALWPDEEISFNAGFEPVVFHIDVETVPSPHARIYLEPRASLVPAEVEKAWGHKMGQSVEMALTARQLLMAEDRLLHIRSVGVPVRRPDDNLFCDFEFMRKVLHEERTKDGLRTWWDWEGIRYERYFWRDTDDGERKFLRDFVGLKQ